MHGLSHLFAEACRPEDLSSEKGAYLLAIRLDRPLEGELRGSPFVLPAGQYLYAGNARGPGGIAARLSRHLRRDKKIHWHIDRLTLGAHDMTALAFPGGSECALMARLSRSGAGEFPVAGFGCSDCRTCPAHLLRVLSPDHWIGGRYSGFCKLSM